jgi:hypothetical protein
MYEAMTFFEWISKCRFFHQIPKVLVFTHADTFQLDLDAGREPIPQYFPDFDGDSTEYETAKGFFENTFRQYRGGEDMPVHFINATDTDDVRKMWSSSLEFMEAGIRPKRQSRT